MITIPTIYGIRNVFPQAHISVLAKNTIADLFRTVPVINEIIPFHKKRGVEKFFMPVRLAQTLKQKAYDLAIIFSRSFGTALMCFVAGIPKRIGFDSNVRNILLTEILERDQNSLECHQVHYYKKVLEPFGSKQFPELPYLVQPEAEMKWAREFLLSKNTGSSAFIVGLNPGSTNAEAKQWLPERFEELAQRLILKYDCEIIIFGDSSTSPLASKITDRLERGVIDVTGQTSVLQLAALLTYCDVLVTNDTGPMHLACAVGTPVVAIFGSTNPDTTAPLGPNSIIVRANMTCRPCFKRKCPEGHHKCMHAVSVDDVENAVLRQFKKEKNTLHGNVKRHC